MKWVIIIIVILVILFIIMNADYNKKVEQHHINRGGFRKSFPKFTGYLETAYKMTLANDTGRNFSYSKIINDTNGNEGILFVGVKLNMADEPIMFTKFQSKYKGEFSGMDVSSLDYNSIEAIEKCINISIEKIKSQGVISYQDNISRLKTQTEVKNFNEKENTTKQKLQETEKPKITTTNPNGLTNMATRVTIYNVLRGFEAKSWSNWQDCNSEKIVNIQGGGKFEGQQFIIMANENDTTAIVGQKPNLDCPVILKDNGIYFTVPNTI